MRTVYAMFIFLACAMIAPLVPDRSGTNLIVAHLFIAGIAVMILIGVMNMNRDRR